MCKLAACLLLLSLGAASAAQGSSLRHYAGGFVRALEFQHKLRICNAYPYAASLDVFRGKEKLTGQGAMPYKACQDLSAPLKPGDKIEFRVGDASAGTFSVSDLPNNDATLLLIIHRHDTLSTAVSFESHVFANLMNAQVAIIDCYKGAARSTPRIMDAESNGKGGSARSEELRYDSVVAVNQGIYEVVLAGQDGETKAKSQLVALNRESYVILRTGVEAQQGPSYPQDLVVYPQSNPAVLRGAAGGKSAPLALVAALIAAAMARTA